MDKYEYKVRSEEISNLIEEEKYAEAVSIADTIDWRRVKSATMLLKIAALYRANKRNEDSREILMLAYDRYPTNRSIIRFLCELSIELDDVVAAIEYCKQFARLAPRDSTVYILRYRILEAQEASLEERIQILEELKKRDYQEEWIYELAYLYHRVGLATKCVEECDDIILWFGDGPYVMKAMELKALHVPLTEVQQMKYEAMLSNANDNYSEENDPSQVSDEEVYSEEDASEQSYNTESYDEQGYAVQDVNQEIYDNEAYAQEGYTEEAYEDEAYAQEGYTEEAYAQEGYTEEAYEDEAYVQEGYTEEAYEDEAYVQEGYAGEAYEDEAYVQEGYAGEAYGDEAYAQEGYDRDPYQESGYTGEFYVEQMYDENGNLIDPQLYAQEGYDETDYNNENYNYAEEDYADENYDDQNYADEAYIDENDVQENNIAQPEKSVDMSQYNTINLQKVVAESMKELFPDDDVFAEERKKFNAEESIGSVTGDTIVYDNSNDKKTAAEDTDANAESIESEEIQTDDIIAQDTEATGDGYVTDVEDEDAVNDNSLETSQELSDITEIKSSDQGASESEEDETDADESEEMIHTGKIAQMVTGVSEAAPEPHTGAIKKVILPGEDARYIKEDSDMDELRDTTEETVNEEHNRMEYNDENVYHEQNLVNSEISEETEQKPATGPMKLDEVLEEWERMKLDNAKKHQEEIRQRILTQTGKIFADFDNSIKSGILGELEREEEAAQNEVPSEDGFLEADVTGDIPQNQLEQDSEPLSELERVVANELGGLTQDIPQEEVVEAIDENEPVNDEQEVAYTDEYYGEEGEYTEEQYAEEDEYTEEQYGEEGEYTEEQYAEEDEYTEEQYAEEGEYTEEQYAEEGEYTEEQYAENVKELDPEDAESIAEMAMEDALKTQEIKMNTADLSSLSEKIVATTRKEAKGAKREEIREFTPEEQAHFENFAVTKKIKKQIIHALDNMTLAAYTGNVIITGDAGLDTVRMAKNLMKEYQASDSNFSGKLAKITGEKINQRNIKEIFEKLNNGGIIIEKANGMSEEKLYEMASLLNQENLGIVVIMEDTKKEITRLLEKQAMIADYFNIRIDLMEMDNNALVAYAKNYALALEYSIDELGTLALYTRIANMQSGNHVVTKDEVRDIIDEAIWRSKKSKIKNFVDVLFARRYDSEDMIVLRERDFI